MSGGLVTFDPHLLSQARIRQQVEQLGFTVIAHTYESVYLSIVGMTCNACVKLIKSSLASLGGIISADVSLHSNSADIQYVPFLITHQNIQKTIEDCGFDVYMQTKPTLQHPLMQSPFNRPIFDNAPFDTSTYTQNTNHTYINVPDLKEEDDHGEDLAGFYSDDSDDNTLLSPTPKSLLYSKLEPKSSTIETALFEIQGMTCASCVGSIEKHLMTLPGIITLKVSLLAQRGEFTFDSLMIQPSTITEAIYDMGFEAKQIVIETVGTVELNIYGMTCASCSGTIEREIIKVAGIISVSINLLGQNGQFTYQKDKIGVRDIVNEIESLGFDAILPEKGANTQIESLLRTKEIKSWKNAFLFSLVLAIPVTFISMFGNSSFLQESLDFHIIPGLSVGDFTQCLLTIPVQFIIGWRFYRSSYKSLKHGTATMDVLVCLGTSLAFLFSIGSIIYSIASPLHPPTTVFFETCTTLVCFIALGRYLENYAKGKTSSALSQLMTLVPANATLLELGKYRIIIKN